MQKENFPDVDISIIEFSNTIKIITIKICEQTLVEICIYVEVTDLNP